MTRLNSNRPGSATRGRALAQRSTANTPAPLNEAPGSLSPPASSDKENSQRSTANHSRSKGKGRMSSHNSLPTPTSDEHQGSRSGKRRRANDENEDDEDDETTSPSASQRRRTNAPDDEDANGDRPRTVKFYDPNQDKNERRDVKRKSRALERLFNENRDDYLKTDNSGLQRTIDQANDIFRTVKQTSDATLDSRLMVSVSDLTHKKSQQLVLGDSSTGIDVDEFVSKAISFMRADDTNTATSTQRRRSARDEDDEDEAEGYLDWARLGRLACFPHNIRPAVPCFLLGPLSVQKRTRAPTQRRARLGRDNNTREARPEELTNEDMSTNERNSVRHECARIRTTLVKHIKRATAAISGTLTESSPEAEIASTMRQHRLTDTGGPSLFDFVINPHSFGQTVENLFYVSFLIKEGEVGISTDTEGLPALVPSSETMEQARENRQVRHQAVFGLDWATWKSLIEAFEIKEPLIPHREEVQATQVGSRGWYG